LLNAPTSPMNVSEIYEWLAEKYLCYQYTKSKVCKVLEHNFKRKTSRFVIANKNHMAGVLIRWTIRPGIEPQLRRLFSGPSPAEPPFPKFHGSLSQLAHCVHCNRWFDRHESFARHQREANSSNAAMSCAVDTSAAIYEPGMGSKHAADEASPVDQSSAITSTRHDRAWDRQTLEERPLAILTTFEAADRSEVV
jgi:hypothetical protein